MFGLVIFDWNENGKLLYDPPPPIDWLHTHITSIVSIALSKNILTIQPVSYWHNILKKWSNISQVVHFKNSGTLTCF